MKPTFILIAWILTAALLRAAPVTGWVDRLNNGMVLGGADTNAPVMGDGSADNATAQSIHAAFPAIQLLQPGDKVTLSAWATLVGINNAAGANGFANQFRLGLFNTGGSATDLGWLGYAQAGGSGTGGGLLTERTDPNTSSYFSTTGGMAVSLATAAAPATSLTNGQYACALTLERVASGLQVSASITRAADARVFASVNVLDATPTTTVFNRAAFLSGSGLNADQIQFADVEVTFSAAPTGPVPSGPPLLGIDFNRGNALGAPSQSRFRVVAGSSVQADNAASCVKVIGPHQVTVSQPSGERLEFRGANGDTSRAIPGGDTSLSFLVADFVATRRGAIDLAVTGLAAGDYVFRSWHLDPITGSALGFAQGVNSTTPNTLEAHLGGEVRATVQPTALGSAGLNTTFIQDAQIPSLTFAFSHAAGSPLVIGLRATQSNGADAFLLLNGFGIYPAAP